MCLIHLQGYLQSSKCLKHLWEELITKIYKIKRNLKNLQKKEEGGDAKFVIFLMGPIKPAIPLHWLLSRDFRKLEFTLLENQKISRIKTKAKTKKNR